MFSCLFELTDTFVFDKKSELQLESIIPGGRPTGQRVGQVVDKVRLKPTQPKFGLNLSFG